MKKLFLFLFFFSLFFPQTTSASDDQRCWEKSKCIQARANALRYLDQNPEDGFVQNGETIQACGKTKTVGAKEEEMGFCLPVGRTETKISFGGKRKFSDVADFVRYSYRYAIMAAGIISVLMVIVAGFQWALSGGNSSTIESARKRINGALMGLTIALLSYSILNFVNPNLVNFRLPEIWLINTMNLLKSEYCADEDPNTKLALFRRQDEKTEDSVAKKRQAGGPYTFTPATADCQTRYFVQNTGGQSCRGTRCPHGIDEICAPTPDKSGYDQCYRGDVAGTLLSSNVGLRSTEQWEGFPWVDASEEELWGICSNGKYFEVPTTPVSSVANEQDRIYSFILSISGSGEPDKILEDTLTTECGGAEPDFFKGFMIKLEMNENLDPKDENHYLGRDGAGKALDLGDDISREVFAAQIKPEFLFPLENFKNGSKIKVMINEQEIADLDDSTQFGSLDGQTVRKNIYGSLGIAY